MEYKYRLILVGSIRSSVDDFLAKPEAMKKFFETVLGPEELSDHGNLNSMLIVRIPFNGPVLEQDLVKVAYYRWDV